MGETRALHDVIAELVVPLNTAGHTIRDALPMRRGTTNSDENLANPLAARFAYPRARRSEASSSPRVAGVDGRSGGRRALGLHDRRALVRIEEHEASATEVSSVSPRVLLVCLRNQTAPPAHDPRLDTHVESPRRRPTLP